MLPWLLRSATGKVGQYATLTNLPGNGRLPPLLRIVRAGSSLNGLYCVISANKLSETLRSRLLALTSNGEFAPDTYSFRIGPWRLNSRQGNQIQAYLLCIEAIYCASTAPISSARMLCTAFVGWIPSQKTWSPGSLQLYGGMLGITQASRPFCGSPSIGAVTSCTILE